MRDCQAVSTTLFPVFVKSITYIASSAVTQLRAAQQAASAALAVSTAALDLVFHSYYYSIWIIVLLLYFCENVMYTHTFNEKVVTASYAR